MKINAKCKEQYYNNGWWSSKTLVDYWNDTVNAVPEKVCVVDSQGARLTFAEVNDAASRVAAWLVNAGINPGDVVSTQLPGWVEFTIVYIACLKAGAVIHVVLPNHRAEELRYYLEKCKTHVLFVPSCYRNFNHAEMAQNLLTEQSHLKQVVVVEKIEPAGPMQSTNCTTFSTLLNTSPPLEHDVPTCADDLVALLFTSGTESKSKGVMFTHNVIASAVKSFSEVLHITSDDVMFMPAPVAHATGFHHGVTMPFMLGATSVLLDRFKPDRALDLMEQERCTCGMGATPIIHDLFNLQCDTPRDLSSLRFLLCGGAPSPWPILEKAHAAGLTILSVYGSTESVPHTVCAPESPDTYRLSSDGCATPRVEVRVVDRNHHPVSPGTEGEECSRGPNVFVGYLNEPELTDRCLDCHGWYFSGDLCVMDADGYLRITGRKKDIIIRGGENISSNEVECTLLRHPLVHAAAVVSMPDQRMGERVCAYVVLTPGTSTEQLTLDNVRAFFENRGVARFKIPERLEFLPKMPLTPTGKIRKFKLRKDIREKLLAEAESCQWENLT